jgi:hypothetical protein
LRENVRIALDDFPPSAIVRWPRGQSSLVRASRLICAVVELAAVVGSTVACTETQPAPPTDAGIDARWREDLCAIAALCAQSPDHPDCPM